MSVSHRERAAEYADAALTMRTMAEALDLRAAEELALAREEEIEAEPLLPSYRMWKDGEAAPLLPSAFCMNMTDRQFAARAAGLLGDGADLVRVAA